MNDKHFFSYLNYIKIKYVYNYKIYNYIGIIMLYTLYNYSLRLKELY